jgi:hypothetical protein
MRTGRWSGRILLSAAGCLAAVSAGGCSLSGSSLATNSGPLPHGGHWSVAKEQWVHVGETFDVSYAVYSGQADYAVLEIEPLGKARVSLVGDRGRFVFEKLRFAEPTPPGLPLVLRASAYRERSERDVMDFNGQLLRKESPIDVADQKIASATLKLHVYQSSVVMQVPPDPAGYKWETGKLLLYADPERPAEVRVARDYRKGFRVDGPSATGTFAITYEPAAEQVKHNGATRVAFSVLNAAGSEHRQETWLSTP